MSRISRSITTLALCAAAWSFPTTTHAADDATYVVRAGDSLYGIAAKFDVRVGSLLAANDLAIDSVILPGQQLTVPGAADATAPPSTAGPTGSPRASGATYTVVAGDSLFGIARRHGVSLSSLLAANDLAVTSLILPGRQLALPAGAQAPAASGTASPSSPSSDAPTTPSPAASGATYTVVAGDSLYAIARRHGVRLSALLDLNDLTVTSVILPGKQLALPAGATTGGSGAARNASTSSQPTEAEAAATSRVDRVVQYALAQQGKPYRFFTRGPDSFDCSGLTVAAYEQIGIDLVHYSGAQARQGWDVDFRNEPIRAGDLIFMKRRGSELINHVGMAIDAHRWIHAPGTGDVVRVGSMPADSSIAVVRRYVEP